MLYDFQKDAVVSIVQKLNQYNGCILADSVGFGKTFTALAVMTYYLKQGKRKARVLMLSATPVNTRFRDIRNGLSRRIAGAH